MAQEEIVKILKVQTEGSEQTVKGLREEIKGLQDALLNMEAGTKEYDDTVKQLVDDQTKLNGVMNAGKESGIALEGSYNALQQRLNALTKAWKATNDQATRGELGKEIKNIRGQLKSMDESTGDFRRNVGNYANSMKDAFGAMGGSIKGVVTGPLNSFKGALTAISTHPIIATITLLISLLAGGLVKGFKANQEATDKLTSAFSGLKVWGDKITNFFSELAGKLADVADDIADFINNSVFALRDAWIGVSSAIQKTWVRLRYVFKKDTEENRRAMMAELAAIDENTEARREAAEADKEMTEAEAKRHQELEKKKQKVRDTEIANTKKNADSRKKISELRAKVEDREKYTAEERLKFEKEAMAEEEKIAIRDAALAKQKYDILVEEHSFTKTNAEESKQEADAYAAWQAALQKLNEQRAQSSKKTARLVAENEKEARNAILATLEVEKSVIQEEIDVTEAGSERKLQLQIELRKKELEIQKVKLRAQIKNDEEYYKAVKKAEEKFNRDVAQLRSANTKENLEETTKLNDLYLQDLIPTYTRYYEAVKRAKTEFEEFQKLSKEDFSTESEYEGKRIEVTNKLRDAYRKLVEAREEFNKSQDDAGRIAQVYEDYFDVDRVVGKTKSKFKKGWEDFWRFIKNPDFESATNPFGTQTEIVRTLSFNVEAELSGFDPEQIKKNIEASYNRVMDELVPLFDEEGKESASKYYHSFLDLGDSDLENIYQRVKDNVTTIFDATEPEIDTFMDNLKEWVSMGIIPQEVLDAYLQALRNVAEEEDRILKKRYETFDKFFNGVGALSTGVSDIIEGSIEAQVNAGELTKEEAEKQYQWVQGLRIAEATINTISGALGAFMGITKDTGGWGIAAAAAQAAAITAAGVAQIQQIANTNPYKQTNLDASAAYPTITPYVPQYTQNVTGLQETEQLANALSRQNIWVSVKDIESAQKQSQVKVAETRF